MSIGYMQDLVEFVAKVDRSLLFWYTRSTPLWLVPKVLKLTGHDQDAGSLTIRKGEGIRSRADLVSKGFDDCSTLYLSTLSHVPNRADGNALVVLPAAEHL